MNFPFLTDVFTVQAGAFEQDRNFFGLFSLGDKTFEDVFRGLLSQVYLPRVPGIAPFLLSNDSPSDVDHARLLVEIERGKNDIERITRWWIHARAIASYLEGQLNVASANVGNAQIILHPIRLVNDDVIGEIFRWCAETKSPLNSNDVRGVPWTLSQVCRRWRAVALDTGRLWTKVSLDFGVDELFMASFGGAHALVQQIVRARSHDFSLDVTIKAGSITDLSTNCVFRALMPFSSFFRSFTIDAGPSSYAILSQCKGSFDRLKSLSICDMSYHLFDGHDAQDPYEELSLDAFTFAPNLECLQAYVLPLRAFTFASSTLGAVMRFSVPLYSQWVPVFKLMKLMNRLECLDLICDCDVDDIDEDPVSIALPYLRQMCLRDPVSWQNMPLIWNKIDVPNLTTLLLSYEGEYTIVTYPLLLTSAISITKLHIHIGESLINPDIHCSLLTRFLRQTPNLIIFCLHTNHLCVALFQNGLQDRYFLPKLRELSFGYSGRTDIEDDAHVIDAMYAHVMEPVFLPIEKISLQQVLSYATQDHEQKWDRVCRSGVVVVKVDRYLSCHRAF